MKNSATGNFLRRERYLESHGFKQLNLLLPPSCHQAIRDLGAEMRLDPDAVLDRLRGAADFELQLQAALDRTKRAEDQAKQAEDRALRAEAEIVYLRSMGPVQWLFEKMLPRSVLRSKT